jgi:hypothetical protein
MNLNKPPLGLRSRHTFLLERQYEILHAMLRYAKAGTPLPDDWLHELSHNNDLIQRTPKPDLSEFACKIGGGPMMHQKGCEVDGKHFDSVGEAFEHVLRDHFECLNHPVPQETKRESDESSVVNIINPLDVPIDPHIVALIRDVMRNEKRTGGLLS